MDDSPAGSIIFFALLLFLSAYFSGTEISLASVNRIHMMSKASKGNKAAERVLYILENFDEALSVLLIGNNVVNIGLATLATVFGTKLWGIKAIPIVTVVTTIVIFMLGEMLPKCFARSCNEKFAESVSGSLILLMKLLKPLSIFFTALSKAVARPFKNRAPVEVTMTEDELYDIVENISDDGEIDEDKGKLVKSALDYSNTTVYDVLVPWDDVVKISTSMKTPQILSVIRESVYSRLPVVDRRGEVKGVLQIRRFLKSYAKTRHNVILSSVTDYPYFARQDVSIDDLLSDMSNHKKNLAIIRNDNNEILGIVTIEDILEELVGEIYDENDVGGDTDE